MSAAGRALVLPAVLAVAVLAACAGSAGPGGNGPTPDGPDAAPEQVGPAAGDDGVLVGAFLYPWYGADGRHWNAGYRGTPVLGRYDSADPEVIRRHAAWATEHGVDFFAASWWGPDSHEARVISGPLARELRGGDLRYCILYETLGRLQTDRRRIMMDEPANRRTLADDLRTIAERHFDNPAYLRINGRPVVFLYLTRDFTGDVAEAVAQARAAVRAATGDEVYLVGDEVYWHAPEPTRLKPWDGVTAYNMHTSAPGVADGFTGRVAEWYKVWADACAEAGTDFLPSALPGFDDTAVRPEARHPVIPRSPDLFAAQLEAALAVSDRIMLTSWNEWHEDTSIEPAREWGTRYLEVLRDTLRRR